MGLRSQLQVLGQQVGRLRDIVTCEHTFLLSESQGSVPQSGDFLNTKVPWAFVQTMKTSRRENWVFAIPPTTHEPGSWYLGHWHSLNSFWKSSTSGHRPSPWTHSLYLRIIPTFWVLIEKCIWDIVPKEHTCFLCEPSGGGSTVKSLCLLPEDELCSRHSGGSLSSTPSLAPTIGTYTHEPKPAFRYTPTHTQLKVISKNSAFLEVLNPTKQCDI